MTTELWMVVAAVGVAWAQIMVAATPGLLRDPMRSFGNRDTEAAQPEWVRRMERASNNMKENLPLFVALVLVVHAAGAENVRSAVGAQVFVVARVLYAVAYTAGIVYVRTLLWGVSIAGMLAVASALFGG